MPQSREEKLAYKKKYNAERAAFLREHNMCAWCGKEKALDGLRLCWDCWNKSAENYYQRYHSMTPEDNDPRRKESSSKENV